MSMIPKGGETIWGGLDWSPEDGYVCGTKRSNDTQTSRQTTDGGTDSPNEKVHYGRLISFGKEVAEMPASEIKRTEFRVSFEELVPPCSLHYQIHDDHVFCFFAASTFRVL